MHALGLIRNAMDVIDIADCTVVLQFFLRIEPPKSEATSLKNFALYLTCGLCDGTS